MTYIFLFILIIMGALLNAARGSGRIKKVIVYGIQGLVTACCFYTTDDNFYVYGVAAFFISWLCNSFGWGDFYPHGRSSNTGDFYPARWCADLFFNEHQSTIKWQTTAMGFRFFLTFGLLGTPLLAYIASNWAYLAVAPLYLLCGGIYRLCLINESTKSIRSAELFNGAYMGAIFGILLFCKDSI